MAQLSSYAEQAPVKFPIPSSVIVHTWPLAHFAVFEQMQAFPVWLWPAEQSSARLHLLSAAVSVTDVSQYLLTAQLVVPEALSHLHPSAFVSCV
jgi:hypothetical protein